MNKTIALLQWAGALGWPVLVSPAPHVVGVGVEHAAHVPAPVALLGAVMGGHASSLSSSLHGWSCIFVIIMIASVLVSF